MTQHDLVLLAKKIGVSVLVFLIPLAIFFIGLLIVQRVLG